MSIESHGGIMLTGETKEHGENPVPLELCPPQISHEMNREQTRVSDVKNQQTTA
jgi:hypothetical protein